MTNSDFNSLGKEIIPNVSVDCIIFGFHQKQTKVLLLKGKNLDYWMLPGGFVYKEENTDSALKRVVKQRTGLEDIYCHQFKVFGDNNRRFGEFHKLGLKVFGLEIDDKHWVSQRFISIGYLALVDYTKVKVNTDVFSDICDWYDIEAIPPLAMDHKEILNEAIKSLNILFLNEYIGFNLLPDEFTMNEIQDLYEGFLKKEFIRSNFQRKMLSLGVLERLDKKSEGKAHKAPYLYKFRPDLVDIYNLLKRL